MCCITDHDLDLQVARDEMVRGIRRRARQIVPNPEDTWTHCIVDGLLADGYTLLGEVSDLDGLIRRNTLSAPEGTA